MRRLAKRTLALLICAFVLTALLASGSASQAAESIDPDSFREYDVGDGSVTMDVENAPFGQVVADRIQPRTRVNIFVAPEAAEQLVTLKVVNLHWVRTLDALVEKVGGSVIRVGANLLRIERPVPISIVFEDEDVRTIIQTIAAYASGTLGADGQASVDVTEDGEPVTGTPTAATESPNGESVNIIIAEDVSGRISMTLNNAPWRAALEQVVKTAGFSLVEEDYGILRVVSRDNLELETGYYRFRYMRPPVPYKGVFSNTGSSGGGQSQGDIVVHNVYVPSDKPSDILENFPILSALQQVVDPDGGRVSYIQSQNTIMFTGTRPRIEAVRQMLQEIDIEPPQIFIDMNFIVTTNEDALNLGLQGGNGIGAAYSGSDILHMMPFNIGGGTGDLAEAITGTAFPAPAGSAFSYGRLNFSQTDLLLQFLQTDTSSRTIQAPKLLALDNQEATIFIGESIRYARTTAATNQNGGLTFGVEEDPNSPVNVGFQLLVIPNVIRGEGKIMMTVIPQRRALNGTTSPIIGFDRFEISGQSIDLPRVQAATLKTAMILESGETAVIGGLLEDEDRETCNKIPIVGDIPFLGCLFQGKDSTKAKSHLLITITPRILKGSDAANCTITEELSARAESVGAEWSDLYGDAAAGYPCADPCAPPPRPCGGRTTVVRTVRRTPAPPPPPPPAPMVVAPAR